MSILIAVLAGFVGGLLGAMIIYEAKNEDKDKSINALVDGHLTIKTALAKTDEKISLIDKSNRIIANEQKRDRIQIWQSLNSLWNEMDKLTAGKTEKKPEEKKTAEKKTKAKAKKEEKPDA